MILDPIYIAVAGADLLRPMKTPIKKSRGTYLTGQCNKSIEFRKSIENSIDVLEAAGSVFAAGGSATYTNI